MGVNEPTCERGSSGTGEGFSYSSLLPGTVDTVGRGALGPVREGLVDRRELEREVVRLLGVVVGVGEIVAGDETGVEVAKYFGIVEDSDEEMVD